MLRSYLPPVLLYHRSRNGLTISDNKITEENLKRICQVGVVLSFSITGTTSPK